MKTCFAVGMLFDGRMRAIFSMMFGASVFILVARLSRKGVAADAADIHYRRMLWMMVNGPTRLMGDPARDPNYEPEVKHAIPSFLAVRRTRRGTHALEHRTRDGRESLVLSWRNILIELITEWL